MRVLVLGGTAWLGRLAAEAARDAGDEVVCLARGTSGDGPDGVELIRADRDRPDAYDAVRRQRWDVVVDVARHPGHVRGAVQALEPVAARYAFVSTGNVYADHATRGADETAALLPPLAEDHMPSIESYGEAKVACEQAVLDAFGADRSVLARAGLLAGPGDTSGRTGYWPLRFAHPVGDDGTVLIPDQPEAPSQLLDARDLAAWLRTAPPGVYNAVGDPMTFSEVIDVAREVAGHTGPVHPVTEDWLRAQGVEPWMGPRSLPLWLGDPDYAGFADRDPSRGRAAGLLPRPLRDTLAETLAWEEEQGVDRPRGAGLTAEEERALLAALLHNP